MAQANVKAVITAEDRASGTLRNFGSTVEKTGSRMGSALKTASKVGLAAVAAGLATIATRVDDAVKRVDTLIAFPKVLKAMGISADKAQGATTKLSESLRGLPTPLQDGAKAVQQFVAAGLDVNKATDAFLSVNNALLATDASAQDTQIVMDSLQRVISAGNADASTMQAILSRMPTVLSALSKESGKSQGELVKLFSENPQALIDNLIRLNKEGGGSMASLEEQARQATGGIGTAWTNLGNAIDRGLEAIVRAFGNGDLQTGQERIAASISAVGSAFEKTLGTVASFIPKLVELGRIVGEYLQPVFVALKKVFDESIGPALSKLWAVIRDELIPALKELWAEIGPILTPALKIVGAFILAVLIGAILSLAKAITLGVGVLTRLAKVVSSLYRELERIFGPIVRFGQEVYARIIGPIRVAIEWINRIKGAISDIRSSIANAMSGIGAIIVGPFQGAFARIREMWNNTIGRMNVSIPDWVPGIGGNSYAAPKLARGTAFAQGGMAMVGERGPEMVSLPRGSQVHRNDETRRMMGGGSTTINITVPMMTGSANERRKVARMLIKDIQDLAAMNGKSATQMLGSNYGLVT